MAGRDMMRRFTVYVVLIAVIFCQEGLGAEVSGEFKKWHKVTLTFEGPKTSETAELNPFLYYRLNVKFTHKNSGKSYLVPGYFAADGDAANTGADSGNKWRVHFTPDEVGSWEYRVSFKMGKNIAVSDDEDAGKSAGFMDGQKGSFKIAATDKSGRDFRGKGMLQYVGKGHLRFAETGEYFLKCGADAPENFLAYKDFDGDFKTDGHKDNLVKDWAPHIKDWKPGDPTWQNGKGKGIIGAVNYLASEGMNAFSFLTLNIEGDDRNVFPYTHYDERLRMDISKLAQWEIVFEHGTKLGMYLHFKTQEAENQKLLDDGDTGIERKLYYRELIARFSHHLALNWNLGEEIGSWGKIKGQNTAQKQAMAQYFYDHDPYRHHIVIHNGENHYDLLGDASKLTGFSLQTHKRDFSRVHEQTINYINRSEAAGKRWVVACDEPGDGQHSLITDDEDPAHDNARKNALWGNIMAGGAGLEWYFGYNHPESDLTCQDYRSRDKMWDQCRHALEFFRKYEIPFWDMKSGDELTADTDDYIFYKPGEIYLVYLKNGGKVELETAAGKFRYGWFNPRTGQGLGGLLDKGSIDTGQKPEVTAPDKNDWLLVIRGKGQIKISSEAAVKRDMSLFETDDIVVFEERDGLVAVEAENFAKQLNMAKRKWYITASKQESRITPDGDENHADSASGGAYIEVLPDTRRTHGDKLIAGENFSNEPGKMAILLYPVYFNTSGRYYVWVRAYSTGSEDNGLHVGIDGTWPASGQRLQWCEGKRTWRWESKQRTDDEHCGEPYKIYIDVEQPGLHTIEFSMREDGFEFDRWLMTKERDFGRPTGTGPKEQVRKR